MTNHNEPLDWNGVPVAGQTYLPHEALVLALTFLWEPWEPWEPAVFSVQLLLQAMPDSSWNTAVSSSNVG